MAIKERLAEDLRSAMRSRDILRRDVIRMAQNAIKYAEIEKGRPLEEPEEVEALRRQARQRRESVEAFLQVGQKARADQETAELAIIESYLPLQKGRQEVEALARQAIAGLGARGPADKGRVMGRLMQQLKGQADGAMVNQVVTELLEAAARA